ncbi:hypothetical protein [Serratia rubidaea]|uniref:hypothetical protein n=1 Tax=Serratia rubidaea TaxID=61652 RepID=UPI0022B903C7|nr:hypothetical protein [Serratia rubidaea]WBF43346.1 hypothetical protein OLD77_11760 [Serratia rubidaea]
MRITINPNGLSRFAQVSPPQDGFGRGIISGMVLAEAADILDTAKGLSTVRRRRPAASANVCRVAAGMGHTLAASLPMHHKIPAN